MGKIIKDILIVIATVAVIDFALGKYLDNMDPLPAKNETGLTDFTLKTVSDDVLVFGSSRGRHHYITSILEDSLNMTAYNVSRDGYFSSYQSCAISTILNRYTPKLIIWETKFSGFFKTVKDPVKALHPYYHQNDFIHQTILKEEGSTTKFKMLSNLYRYNNIAFIMLARHFTSNGEINDELKGYLPLNIKMEGEDTILKKDEIINDTLDPIRVEIFKNTLELIKQKGIKVIVVDSPIYAKENQERNTLSEQTVMRLCQEYGIPCVDNRYMESFQQSPELFMDNTHLNDDGAKIYTNYFIKQIKTLYPDLVK